ncbi:MAG: helix-turn-helix transcriptional regulator [Verrucomicrobia bacterium]|nr:helix-turn-helix transcriptional regulator [Verrucomicrobiota bacterium]
MKTKKDVASVCFCDNIHFVKAWSAKNIRALRESVGMTQTQLANWLGVSRVHVTHLETGFRPAGPQTVRLMGVLEKLHAGQLKPVQPPKRKKTP